MYSYDDTPEDFELKDFSIARDREDVIPMVHAAREKASELLLFASPWSPPAWMKTNGKMDKGGFLRADCRQVWADYTARYLQAYEKEGIPIWGVTVQNEAKAEQGWESCHYEAGEEQDFVTGFLKPAYEKAGLGDRKIFSGITIKSARWTEGWKHFAMSDQERPLTAWRFTGIPVIILERWMFSTACIRKSFLLPPNSARGERSCRGSRERPMPMIS